MLFTVRTMAADTNPRAAPRLTMEFMVILNTHIESEQMNLHNAPLAAIPHKSLTFNIQAPGPKFVKKRYVKP
jgi:hypothetical protein